MREADRLLAQPEVQLSAGAQRPPVPHPSKIPACMLELRRWVCWRYENRHGKPTKVPVQPNGALAKPNDAATWWSFHECMSAADAFGFGVGFMLGDGIVGVDLDHVRDPQTGGIEPWAKEVIDELASYAEVSASGRGIHILCRGALPPGRRRKGPIEMYDRARFFCMTGWRLNDCDLAECTAGLARLHRRIFGDGRNGRGASVARDLGLDDQELIRRACAAKDGIRFKRLWGGDWKGDYPSQSEADLALCSLLAFWTGGNIARIDRLFRMSGLMREKWNRGDYRTATISRAVEGHRRFCEPERRANESTVAALALPHSSPTGSQDEPDLISQNLTDAGNAERLFALHGQDYLFVGRWDRFVTWDGTRWADDDGRRMRDLVTHTARAMFRQAARLEPDARKIYAKHSARMESQAGVNGCLFMVPVCREAVATPEDFDRDPFLLNVANGTIDLRTGELRPHRREDRLMKMAPVRFDPKAKCPRWEQFLREVFEAHPDVIPFLQRAVGYSLTGDVREECFFLLWGKGMNGKGTFLGTLMALLGDYAMAFDIRTLALRKIDADGPSEGIARLRGRRFVKAEEPRDEFSFNEGLLKWLTGGDRIVARRLHENSAEFDPTFKIWVATNPKPVIRSTDFAMWRRVKLIPFTVSFEDRNDPSLKRRLLDELPGILAWAIEGCLRWQEDGLQFPETVLSAIADYRREQDQVGRFLEECCVRTPTATVPARRLYEAYRQWAEGGGEPVASETIIGNRLRDKGFAKEHTWKGWQYVGIGLRTQDEGTGRP